MELALATRTAPAQWREEPDEVIATALDVLDRQAAELRRARRGSRG